MLLCWCGAVCGVAAGVAGVADDAVALAGPAIPLRHYLTGHDGRPDPAWSPGFNARDL